MRLIDADELKTAFPVCDNSKPVLIASVRATINHMPTIDPEIVRCKDCKYWMPHSQLGFDEDNGTYHDYCAKLVPEDEYYAFYRNADDYCSRAERKTDE